MAFVSHPSFAVVAIQFFSSKYGRIRIVSVLNPVHNTAPHEPPVHNVRMSTAFVGVGTDGKGDADNTSDTDGDAVLEGVGETDGETEGSGVGLGLRKYTRTSESTPMLLSLSKVESNARIKFSLSLFWKK